MVIARRAVFTFLLASSVSALAGNAWGETIQGALAKAYVFNSQLNSARAGLRVTDENVAIAKSGYRPTINGIADGSLSAVNNPIDTLGATSSTIKTFSFGVQLNQILFDGFQTRNRVLSAESQVYASQESLRNTQQNILFNAASAYMDVIRDRRIAQLTEQNLAFLGEQVRAARSRFEVGEGTRTDVAQAEASQAAASAQVSVARAQTAASEATYQQLVGEAPRNLQPAAPQSRLLPKRLNAALALAAGQHPAILANKYLVDTAGYQVKTAEGALLPQITATGTISRQYQRIEGSDTNLPGVSIDPTTGLPTVGTSRATGTETDVTDTATIGAQLTVPIYSGGRNSALVRQAKESLGQARIEVDVSRDQVRNAVATAWAQYYAALESVSANRALVSAAQLALNGVVEERNVGQRTTLDVLNSQADVINAQITLVGTERDVVVASYAILSAVGSLSPERLGLKVAVYQPDEHYRAVKDKWGGLRTPDGR